jgi:hypothetical protein
MARLTAKAEMAVVREGRRRQGPPPRGAGRPKGDPRAQNAARSGLPFPRAIRLGDRLAHPSAHLHVGIAFLIALLEGLHFVIGRKVYFRLSSFRTKIFSVSFGMGIVSGAVMPFQFGANWSRFSDATALWLLTALLPLQTFLGDQHGLNTLTCQPAKLAAIEARWTPPAARR